MRAVAPGMRGRPVGPHLHRVVLGAAGEQMAGLAVAAGFAVGLRRQAQDALGEAFGEHALADAGGADDQRRVAEVPGIDRRAGLGVGALLPGRERRQQAHRSPAR